MTLKGRKLARWTGLEPATPGVTGRYSNQLSYHRALRGQIEACPGGVKRETSAGDTHLLQADALWSQPARFSFQ